MTTPKPVLVAKVTTAEEALNESARCLGNANEERAGGKIAAAEKWERQSQYWLDRRNDLAGDGEKRPARPPKLTPVQQSVLDRIARETDCFARVGRGLPFKCNRITARSLADLGLVTLDGDIYASEMPFTIALTAAGYERANIVVDAMEGIVTVPAGVATVTVRNRFVTRTSVVIVFDASGHATVQDGTFNVTLARATQRPFAMRFAVVNA